LDQGEIWHVSLNPIEGHKQRGSRPFAILSMAAFNKMTAAAHVAPSTKDGNFARVRGFPVSLDGLRLPARSVVRCEQPRTLDLVACRATRTRDRLPDAVMGDILARISAFLE